MYKVLIHLVFLGIASSSAPGFSKGAAQKGLEFVNKSDRLNQGFGGEKANLKMIITTANGASVERKIEILTKEMAKDGDRTLITFHWPLDVKGTKMLTWGHKEGDDDQWLYLPALRKIKRISARNKTGSFMGSEFSFEDLGGQEIEKYHHKFVKKAPLQGKSGTIIERVPKDDKSGYSRQMVYYQDDHLQVVKIEYFDRKNEILKTADFGPYSKIGGFWRTAYIDMKNHQTGKKSRLEWDMNLRKVGVKLDDEEFERDSLTD